MTAELLSEQWHAMVLTVACDHPGLATPDTKFKFKVEQGPEGTQSFIWSLADGTIQQSETAPRGYKPDISITMKHSVLLQLIAGDLDFSVGYMRGDVKFEGDPGAVLHLVPELDRDEWAAFLGEVWAKSVPV